jgi:hypothetical protein
MTCNEFKQSIESLFGKVEWRATSSDGRVFQSSGWPRSSSHPANKDSGAIAWSGNAQRVAERTHG